MLCDLGVRCKGAVEVVVLSFVGRLRGVLECFSEGAGVGCGLLILLSRSD